jgi:hypothetical protein
VTNSTVEPDRYAGLAVILGTQVASQRSPTARAQSWVSLQRLGVTSEKAGRVPPSRSRWKAPSRVVPIGRSQRAQSAAIPR